MSSVLRSVKKRKKSRRLGEVKIISREEYVEFDLDAKVAAIRALVPLGLMHVQETLDQEVTALAGERYARKATATRGRRHGSNPGTVGLAGQRVPIRVPRVRCDACSTGSRAATTRRPRRRFPGRSGSRARRCPGGSSRPARRSCASYRSGICPVRTWSPCSWMARPSPTPRMVVALGITMSGEKRFLGFVETTTENEKVLTPFLRTLVERGLDASQGLLVILDGGKGLRSTVTQVFRGRALVQRCQWHKRENVVSYLSKREQADWRRRLQRAYNRPTYDEALPALDQLYSELEDRNQSAARSLAEGLEETLTLHRLGVYAVLGRSFKTTNCLESVNALVEEHCAKVDHWKNSSQRHRWLATALVDIEPRLRKVMGYRHLPKLREALQRELMIERKMPKTQAA